MKWKVNRGKMKAGYDLTKTGTSRKNADTGFRPQTRKAWLLILMDSQGGANQSNLSMIDM
jgi:hypothetical protein